MGEGFSIVVVIVESNLYGRLEFLLENVNWMEFFFFLKKFIHSLLQNVSYEIRIPDEFSR